MVALVDRLTGEIPGLLRRCSPGKHPGFPGMPIVVSDAEVDTDGWIRVSGRACGGRIPPEHVTLDTSDPTGRFHCRLWLQERGHDVGSEDRAEVLAWSVLSVHRGGGLLKGVAGPWGEGIVMGKPGKPSTTDWSRTQDRLPWAKVVPVYGWRWAGFLGPETGDAGKAACDAAMLAARCALTNADGSLTLPPLPEGAR